MSRVSSEPPSSSPFASASAPAVDVPLPGLWKLTWPLLVSLGLSLSLHFTDAFFLSRISDAAAAAAGAINPLLGTTIVLFSAVGQAGASVAGRLLAAGRHQELPRTYLALLAFNAVAGVVVSAVLLLLSPFVPAWLGLRGAAAESAQTYLAVMGGFQFLKAIQLAYGNILNSRAQTRWVMVEAIATNVANIGLNLALLHGLFGLKQSVGAIAGVTVIALLLGMMFTIAVVHRRLGVRFPRRTSFKELRAALRPVLSIGLPSASEPVVYQGAQITISLLVISLGATALATRTYVLSFVTVSSVLLSIALGVGTQIAISHRIGAGRLEEANAQLYRALLYAVSGSGAIALLLAFFHRPLLGLLTEDPEIVRQAAPLFALGVLVEMGRAVNIVAGGALRSSGDAKFTALVGGSLMWALGVSSAYLFGGALGWGLTGVWMAMALDETVRGFVNYRRWRSGRWRSLSALGPATSSSNPPASVGDATA
ncbi:MAG TPA: MATE family efflux transporter [Polyangiaceae bacterium]|nr:MATE family efflux transporter [Polyangiaceae bacterium]